MANKMIEELQYLTGTTINFQDLDTFMQTKGFYSVMDDGSIEDVKGDLNVVYTSTSTLEPEIKIDFEIETDNGPEEDPSYFILNVKQVEAF